MTQPSLAIFDRDGTIQHLDTYNAISLALQHASYVIDIPNTVSSLIEQPFSGQEAYDFLIKKANKKKDHITPELIERVLLSRFEANQIDTNDLDIQALSTAISTLTHKIMDQSANEQKLLRQEEEISRLQGVNREDYHHIEVPTPKKPNLDGETNDERRKWKLEHYQDQLRERQEWEDYWVGEKILPFLSEPKGKEFLEAANSNDQETMSSILYDAEMIELQRSIESLQTLLTTENVFEPYTMQIGFVPGILDLIADLKEANVTVALVTTGGPKSENQYFDEYKRKQFETTLGVEPNALFDSQARAVPRGDGFKEAIDLFDVPTNRVVSIGDDIHSIVNHAKPISPDILPIGVNWQQDMNVGDRPEDIQKLRNEGAILVNTAEELKHAIEDKLGIALNPVNPNLEPPCP